MLELNVKQAKRLMQLMNSINEETVEHFMERDGIVEMLEQVEEIKKFKDSFATKAKEIVDGYNEALKEPFNTLQEELKKCDELGKSGDKKLEKKAEQRRQDLMVKYNGDINELKKVWDVKLKNVEEEVLKEIGDKPAVKLDIPTRFKISDSDYQLFFKK